MGENVSKLRGAVFQAIPPSCMHLPFLPAPNPQVILWPGSLGLCFLRTEGIEERPLKPKLCPIPEKKQKIYRPISQTQCTPKRSRISHVYHWWYSHLRGLAQPGLDFPVDCLSYFKIFFSVAIVPQSPVLPPSPPRPRLHWIQPLISPTQTISWKKREGGGKKKRWEAVLLQYLHLT